MIIVGRHINGITLNPLEYLLDRSGDIMTSNNRNAAEQYLREHGFTDDDMYWMVFEEAEE